MGKRLGFVLVCLLFSIGIAVAQNTVSGTVLGDDGLPVIGATVMVKGTKTGTATDIDGNFSISTTEAHPQLVVSYVGMKTLTVKGASNMKITLEADVDSHQLGEVVVTGMQKMDKRLFTGAATKVDAEKAKLDGVADISRSLEGRAAGVSVQNVSGTFGTAPKIRVRGATSIYGSSKPLWVVDGVIMEDVTEVDADALSSGDAATVISNAIAGLNADDIASFDILKDGSVFLAYIGMGLSDMSLGRLFYEAEGAMLTPGWGFEFWSPVVVASIITVVLYVVGQNLGDASDPRTHM